MDSEGVTALFHAHAGELTGLALMLVDDQETAEDVVQEAFLELHRRIRSVRDPLAYLRTTVVNRSRSHLRRRRTQRRTALPITADAAGADEAVVLSEEIREIRAAVAQLPRRQREVLVLRYVAGLSEAEIAEVLSISKGSVKTHASRGVSAVSTALGVHS